MANEPHTSNITTTHGTIATTTRGQGNPAVLLIHGNSFKSTIFKHILGSSLSTNHQLITIDLPGHGDSSDAHDPEASYTMPAYADAAVQVLQALNVQEVIVVGWSLGGHIAIEMAQLFPGLVGAMLIGCPPVNTGDIDVAFSLAGGDSWRSSFPARSDLTEQEMDEYAHVCADAPYEEWMGAAVERCDQRARSIMFEAFAGSGAQVKQRSIVENHGQVLWAVVNGADEPWINLQFISDIKFARIWRQRPILMEGGKHAPFWGDPLGFEVLLYDFVDDVLKYMKNK